MNDVRTYGKPPFRVAVVHGGPGAGGEMTPVARTLAPSRGVLEPIQTAPSLEGQVQELRTTLEVLGTLPLTLVGFSWGAWLCLIVAARHPELVEKLILVGAGPFEETYVAELHETRMGCLEAKEQERFHAAITALRDPQIEKKNAYLAQLGALAAKADAYDPVMEPCEEDEPIAPRGDLFQSIWHEAARMRREGELLDLAARVRCPVVAIHGTHDPHPAEGVRKPLAGTVKRFQFVLLERCGHKPWIERHARDAFFRILTREVG